MEKKLIVIAASAVFVALAVTCVASSSVNTTPLYTLRMEQASSKMHFLPTAVNGFTYTTEKGYICGIVGCCNGTLLGTFDTCSECTTIEITCYTCPPTSWSTCPNTCLYTCRNTCPNTCQNTCPNTCNTCNPTCPYTCQNTCPNTCWNTCWNTCEYTCEGPECTTIEITCYTCYAC